ncbi:MAG: hypothetical protein ACREV3_13435, partial [Gammaproteobacteria bacterium]
TPLPSSWRSDPTPGAGGFPRASTASASGVGRHLERQGCWVRDNDHSYLPIADSAEGEAWSLQGPFHPLSHRAPSDVANKAGALEWNLV